jgi:glucokinase
MRVLAGDIGGTSTRLAWFQLDGANLTVLAESRFASREFGSLTEIVARFIREEGVTAERACFGVAGPVREGRVITPSLPWLVTAQELALTVGLPSVLLINDLEANTHGVSLLGEEDLFVLNPGEKDPLGNIAVISAGTGLGEALAFRDGDGYRPLACEAGHADFAPRNELESELLLYLRTEYGRVSYERVISGPGLHSIYRFLRDVRQLPEMPVVVREMLAGDPSAIISRSALDGRCPLCVQTLGIFVSLYGAEAGNAALRYLATGGVYVGGGIAPKIIQALKGSTFMKAFTAKGRLTPLMESIPVKVILNDRTALLGAARCASLRES